MRLKGRQEHNIVALTVIWILGVIAFGSMMWSGYLIHESVVSDNAIDASSVALVGQMVSIATLGLGALGAMLSSTSPKPPPPPTVTDTTTGQQSTPVTVVNPTEDPVPTDPADDEPTPHPEPEPEVPEPEVPEPTPRAARARKT